jgi:hypothetical protein
LIFGGISAASGQIMPGHFFYGLKRATERAQLTFALDPRAKARLRLDLAGRRLDEATVLLEKNTAARDQWLGKTVSAVADQLSEAKAQLESLPEKDQETVDVAKYVDRKASGYRRVLRDASRQATGAIQAEAQAASQAADDVSIAAVIRLVKEQKNDGLVFPIQYYQIRWRCNACHMAQPETHGSATVTDEYSAATCQTEVKKHANFGWRHRTAAQDAGSEGGHVQLAPAVATQ